MFERRKQMSLGTLQEAVQVDALKQWKPKGVEGARPDQIPDNIETLDRYFQKNRGERSTSPGLVELGRR
jgi:hypothetical protein